MRNKKWSNHEETYSDLLLFLPFTDEANELSEDVDECLKIYNENKEIVVRNKKFIYPFTQDEHLVQTIIESISSNLHCTCVIDSVQGT